MTGEWLEQPGTAAGWRKMAGSEVAGQGRMGRCAKLFRNKYFFEEINMNIP